MSNASVSSLPAWKQALIERKRRPEDPDASKVESTAPPSTKEPSSTTTTTSGSAWKQTSLGKKLLKYTSTADPDKKTGIKGVVEGTNSVGEAPPGIRIESTGDDHLVEDRLLPIKQNPILLSDRQKRSKVKFSLTKAEKRSDRSSTSPTPSPLIAGSDLSLTSPSVNSGLSPALTNQQHQGGDDSGDEVFDEEVTYGKGFVHKLLQKFINLSGKDDPPPAVTTSKAQGRVRSSGDGSGAKTRNSGQFSNCDSEVIESSLQNGKTAGMSSGKAFAVAESKVDQDERTGQPVVEAEELPQNIVSTTRDIFEHPPSAVRKKPGVVEKYSSEQATVRSAPKRPAPEKPSTDPVVSIRTNEALKNENLNEVTMTAVATETPSGVVVSAKTESQERTQQNLPMNRILYSASGTKRPAHPENLSHKTQTTAANEHAYSRPDAVKNMQEKFESTRERSVAPSIHVDQKETPSDHSVEIVNSNEENDGSVISVKVSSMVGSWGLKNTSRIYDAKVDIDERVNPSGHTAEPINAKVTAKPTNDDGLVGKKITETGSQFNSSVDSSLKNKANSNLKKPAWSLDKPSGGSKVPVETLSSYSDTTRTGIKQAPHDSSQSFANETSADISEENHKERDAEIDKMTTRIKVGGYSTAPHLQIPVKPSSSDATSPYSVPTISSMRTENRVTVIQIGGGAPYTSIEEKPENQQEHLTRTVEARDSKADGLESLQSNINNERKSTRITVGDDEDVTNVLSNSTKNTTNSDFKVSQNNIKNDANNKLNKKDNFWEDPFVKSSSKSNDASRKSDSKSPGVSRPGKLLIRPASNHPASKTKTEFLTMTKFNDIKKGEFAPAKRPIVAEEDLVNGDVVDRGRSPLEDLLDLEQFVFIGGGVSIGNSMLAKTKRRQKLRINFDDSAIRTHEYPSELSLMAEIPSEPGYCDYEAEDVELKSSGLLSSPALTAGEKLSSYTPRSQVDYTFGMDRSEDVTSSAVDPEIAPQLQTNGTSVDAPENQSYSKDISADLLF